MTEALFPTLSLRPSHWRHTDSHRAPEMVLGAGSEHKGSPTPTSPAGDLFSYSVLCFQGKFLAFYQYAKSFNSDDFDYEELKNGDYVFMRWKVSPRRLCTCTTSCGVPHLLGVSRAQYRVSSWQGLTHS